MIFVRHGQSTANATGIWQGQLEFPLSELGREQSRKAGLALARSTGAVSSIYTSPLQRAHQTAEIIARELSAAGVYRGEVHSLPGLVERSGGILEGQSWVDFQLENPELVDKFRSLSEAEAWALVDAEDDEQVLVRFEEAISGIRTRHAGSEGPILVVSHGGALRAFLRHFFGDEVLPGSRRAPNASLTRMVWVDPPRLVDLALTEHLD